MGDMNDHVGGDTITNFADSLNLREAILEKHSATKGYVPTWQRGNDPIDGIFISPTLHITQGGYLPFGESPGDHRAIWVTIQYDLALGYNMNQPVKPQARRMKMQDPKAKKRFQEAYRKYIYTQ